MSSASVLFYGRRSRSSRTFDDLAASSSSSSSSSDTSTQRYRRRCSGDLHRRHRHTTLNDADQVRQSSHVLHPSIRSPVPIQDNEPLQRGCIDESFPQEINNRETLHGLRGRYCRTNRLPGSVLLAKERLLQRLRGVSVSEVRQSRETSPSLQCSDFWVVDADWETNVFREQLSANTTSTELYAAAHQQSVAQESNKKPLGLTKESLSHLHHEVFQEHQIGSSHSASEASIDCSICLENFVEGNKLLSLPCGHRFHTSCLYPWLQTCGECPYCRSCIMLAS